MQILIEPSKTNLIKLHEFSLKCVEINEIVHRPVTRDVSFSRFANKFLE